MLHFLWTLHLGISLVVFVCFRSLLVNEVRQVWQSGLPLYLEILLTPVSCVIWGVRAFLWEFTLPYMFSVKFREAIDWFFGPQ